MQDVLVGEATIRKTVSVNVHDVAPINLTVGDSLRVRARYHFEEALKEKEEYVFSLKCESSLSFTQDGLSRPKPVMVRFGDKWGRNDKGDGLLEQPFKFDSPGEYAVRFEIEAEYSASNWGEARVLSDTKKARSGTLRVHVTAK